MKRKSLTGAIVINLAYGYEIAESNDRFVSLAEEISHRSSAVFLPGATLVNALPICERLLPRSLLATSRADWPPVKQ